MSAFCCFPGFVILQWRMYLAACHVLCLVISFLLNLLRLKICFHRPSRLGQVLFLYFRVLCEGKKKKTDSSHKSVEGLHFLTWPKLEAIFFQTKGSSHKINPLCDRKYKYEAEGNPKLLAPIIETIITLGKLGLTWFTVVIVMTQSIIKKRRILSWWDW